MTSVGGATAIMAESLTKNVKKCSKRKTDISQDIEDDDTSKIITHMGSTCPLMSGYKFGPNTSEGQIIDIVEQKCIYSVFSSYKHFTRDLPQSLPGISSVSGIQLLPGQWIMRPLFRVWEVWDDGWTFIREEVHKLWTERVGKGEKRIIKVDIKIIYV